MGFWCTLLAILSLCDPNENPVVVTKYGKIQGTEATNSNGTTYYSFKGIPYAQSPIGELRWKRPQPVTPWENTFIADKDGGRCISVDMMTKAPSGSEDCLYLNVYVPEKPESLVGKEKSVMVFIHGGGYNSGSGADYKPGRFMDHDVVLVTINYRLGVFGFLSTGDDVLPGNYGMWDQVEALKWVQENIKAFGGDPRNVTIFGESAGSGSVSLHILSEKSKGLFSKAILESGNAFNPWAMATKDALSTSANSIAESTNCSSESSQEFRNCIQNKTTSEVFKAYTKNPGFSGNQPTYFGPVVEPKSNNFSFINEDPAEIFKQRRFNQVPVISGFNKNEGDLLTILVSAAYNDYNKTFFETQFEKFVTGMIGFKHPEISQISKLLKKEYFENVTDWADKDQTRSPFNAMNTDALFKYGGILFIENLVNFGNEDTYFYHFNYNGNLSLAAMMGPKHALSKDKGPSHVDELQYLFDLFFRSPLEGNDVEMSEILLTMWTDFAKTGNPTQKSSNLVPEWQRATNDSIRYLEIDDTIQMKTYCETERMNMWNEIFSNKTTV